MHHMRSLSHSKKKIMKTQRDVTVFPIRHVVEQKNKSHAGFLAVNVQETTLSKKIILKNRVLRSE